MSEYRPRAYLNRVLDASTATHSVAHVLRVMCWQAEFDRPEVTISKPQIMEATGLCSDRVRIALRRLEDEGSIKVIYNGLGGRSRCPTYRLLVAQKGALNVAKGALNVAKGALNKPPTIDSIDSMSDGPPSAVRKRPAAGRSGSGIKRGDRPSSGQSNGGKFAEKMTPEREAETRRFVKALKYGGTYGAAKNLITAWDAGDIEEPPE
ncbi:hypothetical protein [Ruegeria sp.]|uniref:hypothetical protein n=1 Tax=Ruegeria sp. TaxID=1879320 RepID=UPI003C7CCB52